MPGRFKIVIGVTRIEDLESDGDIVIGYDHKPLLEVDWGETTDEMLEEALEGLLDEIRRRK